MVTIAGSFELHASASPPSTSRVTIDAVARRSRASRRRCPAAQPSSAASIWPVWLQSSSIACLPRMTRPGCSASTTPLRSLATASGSTALVDLDQDAAVGAHRQRGADGLLRLLPGRSRPPRSRSPCLLPSSRIASSTRDLVERVHRHLDVGELDARAVGLDPDLDVEIDDPLGQRDQNLHGQDLDLTQEQAARAARKPCRSSARTTSGGTLRYESTPLTGIGHAGMRL